MLLIILLYLLTVGVLFFLGIGCVYCNMGKLAAFFVVSCFAVLFIFPLTLINGIINLHSINVTNGTHFPYTLNNIYFLKTHNVVIVDKSQLEKK